MKKKTVFFIFLIFLKKDWQIKYIHSSLKSQRKSILTIYQNHTQIISAKILGNEAIKVLLFFTG